jgi:hypothetical protein
VTLVCYQLFEWRLSVSCYTCTCAWNKLWRTTTQWTKKIKLNKAYDMPMEELKGLIPGLTDTTCCFPITNSTTNTISIIIQKWTKKIKIIKGFYWSTPSMDRRDPRITMVETQNCVGQNRKNIFLFIIMIMWFWLHFHEFSCVIWDWKACS